MILINIGITCAITCVNIVPGRGLNLRRMVMAKRKPKEVSKAEFVEALDEGHEKDVPEVEPEPVKPELTPLERDPGRM